MSGQSWEKVCVAAGSVARTGVACDATQLEYLLVLVREKAVVHRILVREEKEQDIQDNSRYYIP